MTKRNVLVVGGGLAGMATAVLLAEAGVGVTLVEATSHGGGRARSYFDKGFDREIDNGQHVVMGCYRETHRLLDRLGIDRHDVISYQRNLTLDLVRAGGTPVRFRCPALPAPLHLAAGLTSMRGVGLTPKLAALRMGLSIREEVRRPDDNETCDAWLRRLGQGEGIRAVFWDPLIWSVLNDDPLIASAAMLLAVIERAFMSTRDASCLGVPKLPLSQVYLDRGLAFLRERGATLHLGKRAAKLLVRGDRVAGVLLRDGSTIAADTVVLAVPHQAVADLLPESLARHAMFRDMERLRVSPIVNLWATVDRPLFGTLPFVGLIGSPLHWIFDRDRIERPNGRARNKSVLLSTTLSGARSFVDDDADTLQRVFVDEVRRYFPQSRFEVLHFRAIKEKRATISHAAGTYAFRPDMRTPLGGLLLAGDWVKTGLPATIESAVQSGHQAGAAVLEGA